MRKIVGLLLIVFLFMSSSISSSQIELNKNGVIYVDDDNTNGPWDGTAEQPFQYIQDAIDVSSDGDTVFVFNGTYHEDIEIGTKINLQGENHNTTIIEGTYQGIVVNILSDSVSIVGFTIKIAGYSPYHFDPGINLSHVKHCIISENIIWENYGILVDSSSDIILSKNIINGTGVSIQNSNAIIIEENTYCNTSNDGLIIQDSTNLRIINNSYSRKGITLRGTSLEHWNTHTVQNNVKDGKNICYFKDENNALIPSDSSQIILAHCSNMTIQNINFIDEFTDFNYSSGCIQSGFSSHCTINNNTIIKTSGDSSIYHFSCTHSIISNNHIETYMGSAI
jgi:hypothetical protein